MQTQQDVMGFIVITTFLLFVLISFVLIILFQYQRKQQVFHKELEVIKDRFERELLKTELEIQEETFEHISLELHDNVGHILSLVKLYLTTINHELPPDTGEKLEASVSLVGHSLNEIRNLSRSLNTENIKSNGLIKTVEQLVMQIEKAGLFKVDFNVSGKTCFMEDQKELVIFRIVQEAINNIFKHSKASKIGIDMQYDEQNMILKISDNGIGFDVKNVTKSFKNSTSGLQNIIKRSCLIDAAHEIKSIPGVGTEILIITPY